MKRMIRRRIKVLPPDPYTVRIIILKVLVAVIVLAAVLLLISWGRAEEPETETIWVLCQPDSYVNIRGAASGKSSIEGRAECGDDFETDGVIRKGFLHIVNASIEAGEGWISTGYVVYDQPEETAEDVAIESNGRVACRRTIGGDRRCWVKNGQQVTVYWLSAEWSVTNKGFIQTQYLGAFR